MIKFQMFTAKLEILMKKDQKNEQNKLDGGGGGMTADQKKGIDKFMEVTKAHTDKSEVEFQRHQKSIDGLK